MAQRPVPSAPPATLDEAYARRRIEEQAFGSADDWSARAERLRRHLRSVVGLEPEPARTPLNPIVHSRRELDGYSVENVALETFPGFFCTGNLYRPLGFDGLCAGILCPHGHFGPGFIAANAAVIPSGQCEAPLPGDDIGGRFREDMQRRCATTARLGACVFAFDLIGWGDSTQMGHGDPRVLAFQSWNRCDCLL